MICGARRHFAISWLRANSFPQYKYLVEVREMTDEEAFRLADVENRDRADISDYERACDYASAVKLYYGGKQKTMAQRLQVSEGWLSRYLYLAKLPAEIVSAFPAPNELRELHARTLKPVLAHPKAREAVIERAVWLCDMRTATGLAAGEPWSDAAKVVEDLKRAGQGQPSKRKLKPVAGHTYTAPGSDHEIKRKDSSRQIVLEISKDIPAEDLRILLEKFVLDRSEGL